MLKRVTNSLCPDCLKQIPATLVEENGKILIKKQCSEHGEFSEVYWSDAREFERFNAYPSTDCANETDKAYDTCPFSCGLCENHKSNTLLGIIDLTNKCNLNCWYCFANANKAGFVYEPTKKQVFDMLDMLAQLRPRRCSAVQFSGGEPLVRKDLPELVRAAKEKGFSQILIASNGLLLAEDPGLAKQLKVDGANTIIYLKFNGMKRQTNPENLDRVGKILQACREAGLLVTLVPTVMNNVNNDEVGDIVRFALDNLDTVQAVNFQPISFIGKTSKDIRDTQRYTLPDLFKDIEKQTKGLVKASSFMPISCEIPISAFAESATQKQLPYFSCHPHCGAFTYVFKDGDTFSDYSNYFDLPGFLEALRGVNKSGGGILPVAKKALSFLRLASRIKKFEKKRLPGIDLQKVLLALLTRSNLRTALAFKKQYIFIGVMHFMDTYNFDCQRVERCVIHYATPDGRLIPFCAYNNIHRPNVEKQFALPLEESDRSVLTG